MELAQLLERLGRDAPLSDAEGWDNVGLLVEGRQRVTRGHLTIDLTPEVAREALEVGADFILAYHPPIFKGLKRLTRQDPMQRMLLDLIAAGVSIYSPHTAFDAAVDGVNDWLTGAFGPSDSRPIQAPDPARPEVGQGRMLRLHEPAPLGALVDAIKGHLGLRHVRVAQPAAHREGALLSTIALCAGAGGGLFEQVPHADLFWTGEMRHHDVLDRVRQGCSVVLCDHTNTERGYLPHYADRLRSEICPELIWTVSQVDADPLQVV